MNSSPRYRNLLRSVIAGILGSNLSATDLRSLVQELRRGQFSDELAYMLDQITRHLISDGEDRSDNKLIAAAERLVKKRKISRLALINLIRSLGGEASPSNASIHQILVTFIAEATTSKVQKLLDILDSVAEPDDFLAGISDTRK